MIAALKLTSRTLEKDKIETSEEALQEIFKKLKPGEPVTDAGVLNFLKTLYFLRLLNF